MKFWFSFSLVINYVLHFSNADDFSNYTVSNKRFPENFVFGCASAAYQIEGGWDADGKGESVWDRSTHTHPEAFNFSNGDISSDSYHKYKEDVALLKHMGVKAYRFSISWSRVLPNGFANQTNPAGIQYYKNLLNELKQNNITPLVTMHHWDLPQALEDIGGLPNPAIVDIFVDYARLCFKEFGDYIKDWVTFNEPKQTCDQGYGIGILAPLVKSPGLKEYQCAHHVLLAHAKAYHVYNKEFRPLQGGRVSMVIDTHWYEPASDSAEDKEASERALLFTYGWYGHPLVYGDYPEVMKSRIQNRSTKEGYNTSRLPAFSDAEKELIKGTLDFMTINIYTSYMAQYIEEPAIEEGNPSRDKDMGISYFQPDTWEATVTDWFKVVPWGARKLLKWLKDTYGDREFIVTENGYHDTGKTLKDLDTRGRYHKLYLSNIQDAMYKDGVNVTGYMLWSLFEDFEWQYGYTIQLGIHQVDFKSPNRTRTPKESADYYRHICHTRCLLDECVD